MANRPAEMRYYEQQYDRINSDPDLAGAVTFDPHGDDMADWYEKIGIVLSVSDFESFHLTLADGAAAGAVPVSLAWPGSDQVYPDLLVGCECPGNGPENQGWPTTLRTAGVRQRRWPELL